MSALFDQIKNCLSSPKVRLILPLVIVFIISITTVLFSNYLLALNQKQTNQANAMPGNAPGGGRSGYSTGSSNSNKSNNNSYQNEREYRNDTRNSRTEGQKKSEAALNGKSGDTADNVTSQNGYGSDYSYSPNHDLRQPGSTSFDGKTSTPRTCSFGGNGTGGCAKATSSQWGLKNADGSAVTDNNGDGKIDQKDCPTCSTGIIKDNSASPYAAGVGSADSSKNNSNINNQIKNGAAKAAADAKSAADTAAQKLDLALKNQAAINQQIQDGIMTGSVADTNKARAAQAVKDAQAAAAAATTAAQSAADLSASLNFLFIDSVTATVSSFTTSSNTSKSFILGNPKNNDDYIYSCYILKDKSSLKCNNYSDILIMSDNDYFCCPK